MENKVLDQIELRAKQIIREFEMEGITFSLRNFEDVFLQKEEEFCFTSYFDHWIKIKEEGKRFATASQYLSAKNAVVEYWSKKRDIQFSDVDSRFLHGLERWLRSHRNCRDTSISVYMQAIRTVFNKAIKEDKIIKPDLSLSTITRSPNLKRKPKNGPFLKRRSKISKT